MKKLLRWDRSSAHFKYWLGVVFLSIITTFIWWLGDSEFKYRTPTGALHLSELSSNPDLWAAMAIGDSGHVDVTSEGIILSLTEPSQLQVHGNNFFDWDADSAAGAAFILVTGQLKRLSSETTFHGKIERPAFSMRLMADGERNGTGMVVRAKGDQPIERFSKVVVPGAGTDQLQMYWRLSSPGQWRLQNLAIRSVQISPAYKMAVIASFIAIVISFICILKTACRRFKPMQVAALTGVAAIAVASMGVAKSTMRQAGEVLLLQLPSDHLARLGELYAFELQKSAHIVVFAFLTIVTFWAKKQLRASFFQLISGLMVLALLTEALQRHSIGRTPRLDDIVLDLIGILIGCALFWLSAQARLYVKNSDVIE